MMVSLKCLEDTQMDFIRTSSHHNNIHHTEKRVYQYDNLSFLLNTVKYYKKQCDRKCYTSNEKH